VTTFHETLKTSAWKKFDHSFKHIKFPLTNQCHATNVAVYVSITTGEDKVTLFNNLQKNTSTISDD